MTVVINLSASHAVVTGGATGLGRAVVQRLIDSGARVSVWGNDATALAMLRADLGDRVQVHTLDVSAADQVAAATQATQATWGAPDILVNSAGVPGPHAPMWEVEPAQWRRVMDINLDGVYLCCRALIPAMLTMASARIVNISSISAKDGNAMVGAYAASKAGVISLTKTLGKELALTGVRVNCVTPGAIRTGIFDGWPEAYVQSLVKKIPMGRFGQPEELAAMVAWLCSADASFSTGAVFDMSGGRAVY